MVGTKLGTVAERSGGARVVRLEEKGIAGTPSEPPSHFKNSYIFLWKRPVGGVQCGERNVSLVNIVKLAHGLSVRPTKLIEPIR